MPLSKSAFTVMPSCISIFSTPMSSYTSLNILNVLLTFFCLLPFPLCLSEFLSICYLAMLFSLWSVLLLLSSTTLFFFLLYILGIRFFFFLILTPFSQLHPCFHTLHTPLLSSLLFLLLLLSSSMLLGIDHTTHFLLISQGGILVPDFCRSIPPCLHILYSPHMLPSSLLLSILSLAGVCLWRAYSPPHNIPVPFPIQDIPVFFFAIPFVVWLHVPPLLLFSFSFQPQYLSIYI